MALGTRNIPAVVDTQNRVGQFPMACLAGALGDAVVKRLDLNVFRVPPGRESERVQKAIGRFVRIFPDEVVGSVTVIACSDGSVAALRPRRVNVLHDVTIGASRRTVRQVRVSLGVDKRVQTQSQKNPNETADKHRSSLRSHRTRYSAELAIIKYCFSLERVLRRFQQVIPLVLLTGERVEEHGRACFSGRLAILRTARVFELTPLDDSRLTIRGGRLIPGIFAGRVAASS
jgi:hypothetical protein